jgi:hypothetical protein
MRHIFDLHPAALAGKLLAGQPDLGAARRDAEPEPDTTRPGVRERLAARLALRRRRREAAASARSANA